jgi:hypothetical protein
VLLNSQVYITFIYILLPTFNSDELVTLRGKIKKKFTYAFCKAGRYRGLFEEYPSAKITPLGLPYRTSLDVKPNNGG